jgi:hypothetical protein
MLLLRQEPEGGEEAHRGPDGVHLRRVHRSVQRHHRRGDGEGGAASRRLAKLPEAAEIKLVLDEYVIGQDRAKKSSPSRCTTTTSASMLPKVATEDVELQKSNILLLGPNGSGKTLLWPDARAHAQRAVRDRRRDEPHRGWLRRRGRREHHRKPASERRHDVERPSGASSTSTRSTRSRARVTTRRSPATCRARACSRRC